MLTFAGDIEACLLLHLEGCFVFCYLLSPSHSVIYLSRCCRINRTGTGFKGHPKGPKKAPIPTVSKTGLKTGFGALGELVQQVNNNFMFDLPCW
jgi:hypothetical protein